MRKVIIPVMLAFTFSLGFYFVRFNEIPDRSRVVASEAQSPVFRFENAPPFKLAPGQFAGFDAIAKVFAEASTKKDKELLNLIEEAMEQLSYQANFVGSDIQSYVYEIGGVDVSYPYLPSELENTNLFLKVINNYVRESGTPNPLFSRLNRQLRGKEAPTADVQEYGVQLGGAMAHLPAYEGVSFRGVSMAHEDLGKYVPGSPAVEKAFTSTSLQPTVAFKFAGKPQEGRTPVVFIFQGRTGKPVSYFSEYAQENEILFRAETSFAVIKRIQSPKRKVLYILLQEP